MRGGGHYCSVVEFCLEIKRPWDHLSNTSKTVNKKPTTPTPCMCACSCMRICEVKLSRFILPMLSPYRNLLLFGPSHKAVCHSYFINTKFLKHSIQFVLLTSFTIKVWCVCTTLYSLNIRIHVATIYEHSKVINSKQELVDRVMAY